MSSVKVSAKTGTKDQISDDKTPDPSVDKESCKGIVDRQFVTARTLTRQEEDAADNCVTGSKHSKLSILPNHSLNVEGELEGFCFQCHEADSASMLPLTKKSFATMAIYECLPVSDGKTPYLQLVMDIENSTSRLQEVVNDLQGSPLQPLTLDCMPDWENIQQSVHNIRDQREWVENIPDKIGLYHCFMRTNAQNKREHKVFIVIAGHCINATEELHNLWLDARHTITAKEFMHCAEVSWLRQATIRHHNRLAARVARKFNLNVRFMTDISAVGPPIDMLLPTTCTIFKDLHQQHNTVYVTNDAALFAVSKSGIIFDCWANEGFWVFNGPRDTSSYKIFGTNFKNTNTALAFPCKTVRYNSQYQTRERNCFVPVEVEKRKHTLCSTQDNTQVCIYSKTCRKYMGFMFPHSVFVEDLQKLGFSLNDGITNLMPIVTYCSDE